MSAENETLGLISLLFDWNSGLPEVTADDVNEVMTMHLIKRADLIYE